MKNANQDVRKFIRISGLYHHEVAHMLGIGETTLCRKLRKELTETEKNEIYEMIKLKMNGGLAQ